MTLNNNQEIDRGSKVLKTIEMVRCVVKRSRLNSALCIMVVPQRNVDFKIEICFIFIMHLEWIIKINGEGIEVF